MPDDKETPINPDEAADFFAKGFFAFGIDPEKVAVIRAINGFRSDAKDVPDYFEVLPVDPVETDTEWRDWDPAELGDMDYAL